MVMNIELLTRARTAYATSSTNAAEKSPSGSGGFAQAVQDSKAMKSASILPPLRDATQGDEKDHAKRRTEPVWAGTLQRPQGLQLAAAGHEVNILV